VDIPTRGVKVVRREDEGSSKDPTHQESLQQAERLFWQGKLQEALDQLDRLEAQDGIPETKQLKGQLLKCRILANLNVEKAQDVANQIVKASQDLDQQLIRVDALLVMAETLQYLGKYNESLRFVDQGKAVLATIPSTTAPDLTAREATVLALEGGIYAFKGPTERAVDSLQQSLMLREQLGKPQEIANSLCYLGLAYLYNVEFDRAVDSLQQSLTIRERLQHPQEIAHSLLWLGWAYTHTGEMERALECFQQSLAICEQLGTQH